MKENTHYTPRLIGSFLLSVILAWGLNMLLSLVLVSTLVLVPLLLNSIFDFSSVKHCVMLQFLLWGNLWQYSVEMISN